MIAEYIIDVDTRRFDSAGAVADEIDRVMGEKFGTRRGQFYIHTLVPHVVDGQTVGYVIIVRMSKSKGIGQL